MGPSSNFDLRLSGTLTAVSVEVLNSHAGQYTAPTALPCNVSPQALEDLRDAVPGVDLKAIGSALWRCAFGDPVVRGLWERSKPDLGSDGILRLRLTIDAAALAALPWELLYDETMGHFLALNGQTPVTRFPRLPIPSAPWPDRPLRLLFTGASPSDMPAIDVAKEWTGIEQMIAPLVKQGRLETPDPFPLGATLPSLLAALRRKVDIWHFAGHGTDSGLVFCEDHNKPNPVDAGELGQMLLGEGVRLAVINACRAGAEGGQAASVAGALLRAGIPAVVAMQANVSDVAAEAFATAFYDAISVGQGVDQAVTAARKAIWAAGTSEWWTPALLMRTPEGQLWQQPQTPLKSKENAKDRRIDAAAPSSTSVGRSFDVLVQVRFVDSPVLELEAWPEKRRPLEIEQESQAIALKFPVDRGNAGIGSATVVLRIVAPSFKVAGPIQTIIEVPPQRYSPLVAFTLIPHKSGVLPINIEVYDLDQQYLGMIPLDTLVLDTLVQGYPLRFGSRRASMATLTLIVKVELASASVQSSVRIQRADRGESEEREERLRPSLDKYLSSKVKGELGELLYYALSWDRPVYNDYFVTMLRKADLTTRLAAVRALGYFGRSQVVGLLIDILGEENSGVRLATVEALARIGDPRAVKPLIDTLREEDLGLRLAAVEALARIRDPRAVKPLIDTLREEDLGLRLAAVEALARIHDPRAIKPLIDTLREEDLGLRLAAIEALARIGDSRAIEPLITILRDQDSTVRLSAVETLARIGDTRAIVPLITILRDQDSTVRLAAVQALARIGDTRAIEPLITMLREEEYSVRHDAVHALGSIGDQRAVDSLINVLREDLTLRGAAAVALGRIGDPRASEPLAIALRSIKAWDTKEREPVTNALRQLGW